MESFLGSKRCTAFWPSGFCDTPFCIIYSYLCFCYLRFAFLLFFVLSKKRNLPCLQTHFFNPLSTFIPFPKQGIKLFQARCSQSFFFFLSALICHTTSPSFTGFSVFMVGNIIKKFTLWNIENPILLPVRHP